MLYSLGRRQCRILVINRGSSSEEPISRKSGRANLEGEYLSEFIDLLVKKGARVAIQN